jgi:hypothetical protein
VNDTPNKDAKLAITLLVLIAATALLWAGRINGDQWVSVVTWIVAIFMLGQAAAIFASGYATATVAKASQPSTLARS